MAIGILFDQGTLSRAQYDAAIERLEAAGAGSPPGRLYHHAFSDEDTVSVFDVWDSMSSFEAFGATLMPIMGELGVDPGEPKVSELRNTIVG
jgi:hypothetical protein